MFSGQSLQASTLLLRPTPWKRSYTLKAENYKKLKTNVTRWGWTFMPFWVLFVLWYSNWFLAFMTNPSFLFSIANAAQSNKPDMTKIRRLMANWKLWNCIVGYPYCRTLFWAKNCSIMGFITRRTEFILAGWLNTDQAGFWCFCKKPS